MWTSLVTSLPLILVIMTAWVDGQQYWAVNYGPSYVCALKGTTVKLSCVLNYPHDHEITTSFWSKTAEGETPNLCLVPENRGRVQCDSEYKDTYRITLTSVTEADKHMYYCRFTTNRGTWTGIPGAQLDVTDLQVETQPSVKERDSVTLTCKSSCSLPQQTFIWYRNTQIVTTGIRKVNHLQLPSVSRHDSGNYQCAVSGYPHLISPPVYLKVQGVDGLQDWGVNYSPSYVCALKGSTVKMSCVLNYSHDHELTTVFWTKPAVTTETPNLCLDSEYRGRVQCDSEYKDTYSLTLTNITEADKHMYYCRFTTNRENGKWTGIPGAQLDVTDLQVETQQSVKEGGKVILRCKSSCSLPQQTFIWYRNTQIVTTGIRKVNHLQLPSVSRHDSGNYRCAVSGYPRLISPPVYLKVGWVDGLRDWGVNYSPSYVCALKGSTVKLSCTSTFTDLQVETQPSVKEKDSVTLTCKSSCSLPQQTTFIWYRNRERLTELTVNHLQLPSVSRRDSGNYRCAVSGYLHLISPPVYLKVGYPPKNVSVSISASGEIVEGDSVTLNCSSDSNPPALIFSWFKENQRSAVGSGQSFIISSFNSSHSGRYYCAAQNQYGSQRSASVSVSVKGIQRAALHTLTGIVTGCGALIFIIVIIIVLICRKKRRESESEDVNQKQTADSSDDTYTALDPVSRTSADIYSTIRSGDSRAPDETYTALELQSRSSEYETLAGASADPH